MSTTTITSTTTFKADSLLKKAQEVASLFRLPDGYLQKAVDAYIVQAANGLEKNCESNMPMIPSYVSHVPTGQEKGTLIALDLGGTNFRVCSIELHGDSTYDIVQEKTQVPNEIMVGSLDGFIKYLADRIESFVKREHPEHVAEAQAGAGEPYKVGFTFSFPLEQLSANSGRLIRWTKGYHIEEAVGKDLPQILQSELNKRKLNLLITAVVNDTVGTLLTRAYTKPSSCGPTIVGCIFGTGTNGAYSEPLANVKKFDRSANPKVLGEEMVINTEWGSFDNELNILPNTKYDEQLDKNTPNKGVHMFEKRVSGMFLGELLRLVMVDLYEEGYLFTSQGEITEEHALYEAWSLDTSTPAIIHGDTSDNLEASGEEIQGKLKVKASLEELQAIKVVATEIGTRSGYLSSIPIAGALLHSRALEKYESVDVGADGSVFERYPGFHEMIMDGLSQTDIGPENVKRITMGIAKDGSGVGAALCALEADV